MFRILVVDDSAAQRQTITRALSADPEFEVVGGAPNGHVALAKILQLKPDLVILDLEMPEMDGLELLRELKRQQIDIATIIFSIQTQRGAAVALEALMLGANECVAKPQEMAGMEQTVTLIKQELAPKIKALCQRRLRSRQRQSPVTNRAIPAVTGEAGPGRNFHRVEVLAIGASTGGPEAVVQVLSDLPRGLPVPLVIAQHIAPSFTKLLAQRLTTKTPIPVSEGVNQGQVTPGQGWIAPGDYHMTVTKKGNLGMVVELNQDPPENSCRPSVDVLFRSVARAYGHNTLAVILTGMGEDGLKGCEMIKAVKGTVLVQDEKTSAIWGMPGAVAQAGLADRVLPLGEIAKEIMTRIKLGGSDR